jgi:chromosome segregation ATPase
MQSEMEVLKADNAELKTKMQQSEEQMGKLTEIFKRFERTLEQKDEVINSIFVELKEIRQWK